MELAMVHQQLVVLVSLVRVFVLRLS